MKKQESVRPLSHRFTRTFLNGITGVALASTLSFGMIAMTGCATDASAVAESVAETSSADAADAARATDTSADAGATDVAVDTTETTDAPSATDATADSAIGDVTDSTTDPTFESVAADFNADALDLEYSKRDTDPSYEVAGATTIALSGAGADVSGEGVEVADRLVTITAEGTYILSGNFEGCVMVDAPDTDKVQLVFDGVTIVNETSAAVFVKQADKCFITLADGSENTLEDGENYTFEEGEDEPNAALFSKEDLTINGAGKLTVSGNYRHAIASKDDLVITGGEFDVTSVEDALRGKDCVKISDGTFNINAGRDGIKSSNDTDATRGFVSIDGGTFDITAGDEGIQATTYLRIAGGEFIIDAVEDTLHSNLEAVIEDGDLVLTAGDDAIHAETILTLNGGEIAVRQCYEGYEAEKIYVNDGLHYIVASDDALNAAVADLSGDSSTDQAANFEFGTPGAGQDFDRGFEREGKAMPADMMGETAAEGELGVEDTAAPEGTMAERRGKGAGRFQFSEEGTGEAAAQPAEGDMPAPAEGVVPENGSNAEGEFAPEPPEGDTFSGERPEMNFDMEPPAQGMTFPEGTENADGAMGAPGARGDMGGRGGMGGPGGMAGSSADCLLQINGGYLWVDAEGDGLDSNGSLEINGGTVLVNGPSIEGNGGLDYEYSADVNGGSVIILGPMGMAADFSQTSTQPFVSAAVSGQAGDTVALVDSNGQILVAFTAAKSFQLVQASSADLVEGQEYSIVVGGTIAEGDEMGFVESGNVEGGSTTSVTASTTPSGVASGMMGGHGGRGGRF